MEAREWLQNEIKIDFNTRQLVKGLDALYQEELILILNRFAEAKIKNLDLQNVSNNEVSVCPYNKNPKDCIRRADTCFDCID